MPVKRRGASWRAAAEFDPARSAPITASIACHRGASTGGIYKDLELCDGGLGPTDGPPGHSQRQGENDTHRDGFHAPSRSGQGYGTRCYAKGYLSPWDSGETRHYRVAP